MILSYKASGLVHAGKSDHTTNEKAVLKQSEMHAGNGLSPAARTIVAAVAADAVACKEGGPDMTAVADIAQNNNHS